MKQVFLIAALFAINFSYAQRSRQRVNQLPVNTNYNLLDMPGYKKAPIPFVPFSDGPEARRKGFKPDSIYTWVTPDNKKKRATGQQILDEVNAVEKDLATRGRSLRNKSPFEGLVLSLPPDFKTRRVAVPPSFVEKNKRNPLSPTINTTKPPVIGPNVSNLNVAGYMYPYFGILSSSNEFPGSISDVQVIEHATNGSTALTVPLVLAIDDKAYSKIGACTMEIYKTANKTGSPLFSVPVNIKSPSFSRRWSTQIAANTENIPSQPQQYGLYAYNVQFTNTNNSIPKPNREHSYYYVVLKFTDVSGKQMMFSFQNQIRLDNTELPPIRIQPIPSNASINGINYDMTDHGFGIYIKSNGFKASTSQTNFGYYGEEYQSSISADFSMGIHYYNFENLVNSNAPKQKDWDIIGFNFSAKRNATRPDQKFAPPTIRVPGKKVENDLLKDPNTHFSATILGEKTTSQKVEELLFNERFFIGPVPCIATILLKGEAGVAAQGTYAGTDMQATITPYMNLQVIGSGGVDAYIAWAKVNVGVDLIDIKMPITLTADNPSVASVDAAADFKSLSGRVSFEAGFCIPIPFFDDICKSFTIPIVSWPAPLSTSYTITANGDFNKK